MNPIARFRFSLSCAWLLAGFVLSGFAAAPASKPNVILILADDFGYECVAANGGAYPTPHLDRLAATGMRFENCHVQPLCTPTRVQLMTGQYNLRNYVEFGFMQPDSTTFANLFKKQGYATCIAGKWQLGTNLALPQRWGFDEHCLWQFTRRPERYKNPGLEVNGQQVDYTKDEYGPDVVSDYALDFITRNRSQPFLLYYPMMLTHEPFVPTPDSPDYRASAGNRKARDEKYFADMVTYADKLIGRLIVRLDELKLRDNTLVLFLGDNGTHSSVTSRFRGRDYTGGKGLSIGSGTHVPLIANWPGIIPAGRVNPSLVDSTDLLPTLCAAAGITLKSAVDGRSFWPQLQGKAGSPREWSYCWYAPRNGRLKFEFARDLKYKLYRDGPFVEVVDDHQELPLSDKSLTAEAGAARAKLAKVLQEFQRVQPAVAITRDTPPAKAGRKARQQAKPGATPEADE